METLELLGVALGLGTLAGLNLYLTVFVTGLAVQQGWISLHAQYESLAILGDPVIVTIAGILFFLEFFADKVPWVDSLWDSVHTIIRPVGGALLAITVLGDKDPAFDVVVGLLAGGMALTTHGAKAGTRLLANTVPEPFSNIALSVAEDVAVLGGLTLIYISPTAALIVSIATVLFLLWMAPKILRSARTMLWLLWRRIQHLVSGARQDRGLPLLPEALEIELIRTHHSSKVLLAAPCVTGSGALLKKNRFGWLLVVEGATEVAFATKGNPKPTLEWISMDQYRATHRSTWICERIVLYDASGGRKQVFQLDRSRREVAARLAELFLGADAITPPTQVKPGAPAQAPI